MRIFGALLSPFVRKVCLAAEEKGIAWELVPARAKGVIDPGFLAASPLGKMPAMDDGGYALADSSAIVHYLEAKHPAPPLIPAEPQARGRAIWLEEFADGEIGVQGLKVLFNRLVGPKFMKVPGDERIAAEGEAALPRLWDVIEAQTAGEWLGGGAFTIGDIAVAAMIRTLDTVGTAPDPARWPGIAAWYARVRARPAWMKVAAIEDMPRG